MSMLENDKDYWRWQESCWIDERRDWRTARIVSAGIDIGSVSSQAVVCVDGELYGYHSMRTGGSSPDSARKVIDALLARSGMAIENLHYLVGTGYGRINIPFAHKTLTEIACHARGANYMAGPSVRTLLDMGGQDCKVIRCDERGKVERFLMNDKCAAGTGRGMEVIADLLKIPVVELGERSFAIDAEPPAVSSICVVFARSEALGLIKAGYTKNKVIAAYCQAMAERVVSLIKRIGVEQEFFITGGIAKNSGVVKRIERLLGVESIHTKYDSQIAGALGAALFGHTLMQKQTKES
ncbi:MAG TPA: benzoyl-CoA reductase, bzd-type, subunit Q [Rhodocyclaceae bacterium]|nr:benzoyl-CoA reductase, bzd-type, subunit Q [Rhodocyclaceae bacterium]